jgi:hypothetical protein
MCGDHRAYGMRSKIDWFPLVHSSYLVGSRTYCRSGRIRNG